MANLNKVMLIGRLTRDPEARMFASGGKVTHFGFAVNNSRKNPQTGEWESVPVFIDCEAFNRGERGTLADRVEQYLKRGMQIFIEGHLKLDEWTDKQSGQKRSKLKVIVDNFEFFSERRDDTASGGGSYQRSTSGPRLPAAGGDEFDQAPPEPEPEMPAAGRGGEPEDIPF